MQSVQDRPCENGRVSGIENDFQPAGVIRSQVFEFHIVGALGERRARLALSGLRRSAVHTELRARTGARVVTKEPKVVILSRSEPLNRHTRSSARDEIRVHQGVVHRRAIGGRPMICRIEPLEFDPHGQSGCSIGGKIPNRRADLEGLIEGFGANTVPKILFPAYGTCAPICRGRIIGASLCIAGVP